MVEYECNNCHKKFNLKGDYARHLNRKIPCNNLQELSKNANNIIENIVDNIIEKNELQCSHCNKKYSRKYELSRHIKNGCKEQKKTVMEYMLNELSKIKYLEGKIERLEKQNNLVSDQINHKQIPKTIRAQIWNKYIGKENGIGKCYVCETDIDAKHFEAGHIIAKADGGANTIDNLRPVCSLCNKSVGKTNMKLFKEHYFSSDK